MADSSRKKALFILSELNNDDIDWIGKYLNQKDVQKALGVEVSRYDGCNFDINR